MRCAGFSLRWLLLLWTTGSRRVGSRAQAQQSWHTGLVALRHVGSSRTRAPCIGRRTPNHCTTRKAWVATFLRIHVPNCPPERSHQCALLWQHETASSPTLISILGLIFDLCQPGEKGLYLMPLITSRCVYELFVFFSL